MGDVDLGLLDDDDYIKSVLRTKRLGIAECFIYRLPSGSKSPYRADGWPLTKPLQCVSLRVERRDNSLLLIFTYTHDGKANGASKLFALSAINLVDSKDKELPMEHYVESVLDSTRFFVIRVTDDKAGREALVGLGFRDRQEANDFRSALSKYESEIASERK
ncbi:unnamed protein product [Cylindrotheca closterium]|uniref:NECAP PHear domain-containing protein n=1 Tax=Cylindrotheca closterium TaxID=2856 RepID=A0AAD2JJ62_9STRA|nr:unnamed protein product [Cylindrotheca closterium]